MTAATKVTLTDTQAEALRILVGMPTSHGATLARATAPGDDHVRATINGRAGRALIEAGMAEWLGGQPDGFVVATDEGRWWVHADGAPGGLDGEARAELDAASRADALDDGRPLFTVHHQPELNLWVIDVPDGWDPADGAWSSAGEAMKFLNARMGRTLAWLPDPGDGTTWIADPVEHDTDDLDEPSDEGPDLEVEEIGGGDDVEAATADPAPASTNTTTVALTHEGRPITTWDSKILAPTGRAIHGTIPPAITGTEMYAVIRLVVAGDAYTPDAEQFTRTQTLRTADLWPVPDAYGTVLAAEVQSIVDADAAQPRLPIAGVPAGTPQELIDRLNREELEVRDDKGRRSWPDDTPPPTVEVAAERVAAVLDLLDAAGTTGYPARSLDLQALAALVAGGRARVEPEWWLTDPGRDEEEDGQPWAWTLEEPADPVLDALEAAEQTRPQYRVQQGSMPRTAGLWVVIAPDGHPVVGALSSDEEHPTGVWASKDQAVAYVEAATGPLEWTETPAGTLIADAPEDHL